MNKLVEYEKQRRGTASIDLTKYRENRFEDVKNLIPDPEGQKEKEESQQKQ